MAGDSNRSCLIPSEPDEGGGPATDENAAAFDHVYGNRRRSTDGGEAVASPSTTAILYGVAGSPAMMGFHRVLKAASDTGTLRYVFRHALPSGSGDETITPLQGYGVVLDVKNMEYLNYDSTSASKEVTFGW